jgi:hypothetical protein
MRWNRCLPALALVIFLPARADEAAASARPKEAEAKNSQTSAAAKPEAAGGASLTAARDPVTGGLRPLTPEEAHQLLGRRSLAAAAPQVVTLPNGTRMMRLGPGQASLSVARRNTDGTLTSECVHGTAEARSFLEAASRPAPAPATPEK